jgi:hypothetical protein
MLKLILLEMVIIRFSNSLYKPNPGGLVENVTSKTQYCFDKFIIHLKHSEKFVILHKCLVFNFL